MKKVFSGSIEKASPEGGEVLIEGWANKAVVDSVGDLMKFDKVDLKRFKKNPILLYNHNRDLPIGIVTDIKVSDAGLWVKAKISKSKDAVVSYVRDLVAEGILKTFSIGFEPRNENFNREAGYNEISEWALNELSIVTLPANMEAEFALAKSLEGAKDYAEAKAMVLKALEDAKTTPTVEDTSTGKAVCPDCGKDPCECNKPSEGEGEGGESSEDEEAKKKSAFQDCVSAKIPKLIEEGKPEEQAVAVAMSMCREEGKCDISIMSQEMFDHAMEVVKVCKKPKKDGESTDSDSTKSDPPPVATPVSQPSDDPSNFGSPQIDLMKSMLALIGKISEQLGSIQKLLEKEEDMGENGNVNPALPPENGEASAKGLAKIAEIHGRVEAMVKGLVV